jgi:UDP-MurNAc hydroxylase
MRITYFYNAGIGIQSNSGQGLLLDPWLTPGAYLGSWFHLGGTDRRIAASARDGAWDAVYVSHLHPDHFDTRTLTALARRNPDLVFLVPRLLNNWLALAMRRLVGTKRVIALGRGETYSLRDISIKALPLDMCDPTRCFTQVPCHSNLDMHGIDSACLVKADGVSLLAANDALSPATSAFIESQVGCVTVIMGTYGGASPYPQCYEDLSVEDMHAAQDAIATRFCDGLASTSNALGASLVIPYAGEYELGGRLSALNPFRASWPKSRACEYLSSILGPSRVLGLGSGDQVQVDAQGEVVDLEKWREDPTNMIPVPNSVMYPYEKRTERDWPDWGPVLSAALKSVAEKFNDSGRGSCSTGFILDFEVGEAWIEFASKASWGVGRPNDQLQVENETTIRADPRLLKMIVTRSSKTYSGFTTAHWNQAELGSHFKYSRRGSYEALPHLMLNFLQGAA